LHDRMQSGEFRHDLYFRLCAFQIRLPPLRERVEDIAPLAEYFTSVLASPPGSATTITSAALAELERRPWHGNVRELRNAVDHALILARGRAIAPEHLPPLVKLIDTVDAHENTS